MEPLAYELICYDLDKSTHIFCETWQEVEAVFRQLKSLPEAQRPASVSVLEYSMDGNLSSSETVKLR